MQHFARQAPPGNGGATQLSFLTAPLRYKVRDPALLERTALTTYAFRDAVPTAVSQEIIAELMNTLAKCYAELVSYPVNTLLDPPANCRAGQGAPTRQKYKRGTGEEAQRRPARKGAAQRVRYLRDRTLVSCPTNNLLDPPTDCRAGQGAPTRPQRRPGTGEETQRRPVRKDVAQRVSY